MKSLAIGTCIMVTTLFIVPAPALAEDSCIAKSYTVSRGTEESENNVLNIREADDGDKAIVIADKGWAFGWWYKAIVEVVPHPCNATQLEFIGKSLLDYAIVGKIKFEVYVEGQEKPYEDSVKEFKGLHTFSFRPEDSPMDVRKIVITATDYSWKNTEFKLYIDKVSVKP